MIPSPARILAIAFLAVLGTTAVAAPIGRSAAFSGPGLVHDGSRIFKADLEFTADGLRKIPPYGANDGRTVETPSRDRETGSRLACLVLAGRIWITDGTQMVSLAHVEAVSSYGGRILLRAESGPVAMNVADHVNVHDILADAVAPCLQVTVQK